MKKSLTKRCYFITIIVIGDPLIIKIDRRVKLEIDLAADKVVAADRAGQKIAVEIKSFLNPSAITDFHAALGQFLNYRLGLQMTESDRPLYLAVPIDTYNTFFQQRFIQEAVLDLPGIPEDRQRCFLNERENQFSTRYCRGGVKSAPTTNLNSNEKRRLPDFSIKNETALPRRSGSFA